ncbi:hypothetical protein HNQ07_002217 [Deinococcus metalli]|uniref:Uncharacterized protein n=1 Tax=Deinococcus metalli TaxID=1141878 RepID=A0A7W8KFF1_9DEIO|nr:hypothetical protein [Deinococcus metalli]GHF45100.1 hypothetical protein GCM10017781_21820 [Deinococcus metalli]
MEGTCGQALAGSARRVVEVVGAEGTDESVTFAGSGHGEGIGVGSATGQCGGAGGPLCTDGPQVNGTGTGRLNARASVSSRTSVRTADGGAGRSGKTGRASVAGGWEENARAGGGAGRRGRAALPASAGVDKGAALKVTDSPVPIAPVPDMRGPT